MEQEKLEAQFGGDFFLQLHLACHNEERLHLKILIFRTVAFRIVKTLHIHNFFVEVTTSKGRLS